MTDNHMTPRKFLATELRRARAELGMTVEEFGKVVNVGEGMVRSCEKGRRIPHPDSLKALEEVYPTKKVLLRFRQHLIKAASTVEWFGMWPTIEGQATSLWWHELNVICGLLQTEEYAREIFIAAELSGDIDQMVSARMKRQEILGNEESPNLVVLMSENTLDNNIGGPDVMHAQLQRLAREVSEKRAIIHIIPNRSRACAGYRGPFVIAEYTDEQSGEDRTAVYIDNAINGEVTDDHDTIVRLRHVFDTLRAHALNHDESFAMIVRKAEEWKE